MSALYSVCTLNRHRLRRALDMLGRGSQVELSPKLFVTQEKKAHIADLVEGETSRDHAEKSKPSRRICARYDESPLGKRDSAAL